MRSHRGTSRRGAATIGNRDPVARHVAGMDSARTPRHLLASLGLVAIMAACNLGSPEPETTADSETTGPASTDPTTPEACPGVTDPECTTDAPCGNDEECILCECRPTGTSCEDVPGAQCSGPDDCGDLAICVDCVCQTQCNPDSECFADADCGEAESCHNLFASGCGCVADGCTAASACQIDSQCATDETCVDCECVAGCACAGDEDCVAPQTCDGCACVDPAMGCATGDAVAPNSPDVTVSGTTITGEISGNPADCPVLLCSFSATNNTGDFVTIGVLESSPDDEIAPMPIVSVAAAGETVEFEVWANDCTTPASLPRTLFIHDEVNGISLGEVPLMWQTSLP